MMRIALVLLFSLLMLPAALAEKRVALVIGIDKYDNLGPQAQLRKARSDAAAVARTLNDLGFDVISKEDVSRSAFNSHWQDFLNKLTPGDTATFYFAGHGVEFGGRTYLVPRDVPSLRPGRDELLRREALSLQEFLADLKEKGTRLNLVILDACRENPFEQAAGRSLGGRRGLAITEPPEGTFIMYSAGAGESALDVLDERDRDPNSVYTRHLLPLLKTPSLTLTEVAEQVRVSVRQMAATVQHVQTPAYYNQVLGRVCLAGGDCTQRGAPTPVPSTEAERAWQSIKDISSIAALEAFIRRYGDTYYGDLAKARLAELKQAEALQRAAEGAKRKADEEASARAETERVCARAKGTSDLAVLKMMAGQYMGAPAADCIASRLDTLEKQQAAMLKAEEDRTRSQAHQFPGGTPIEMIALFGASTASTQAARILAEGMAKVLGAAVPILDKPGAGGAVGYVYLSQQKPDGHSLVWGSNSISTTFHSGQLPFDYRNFEHVARVTVEHPALAVKADSPWKSLKELIQYAKANPEKVRVGNSGQGSQTHIASVALFSSVGVKVSQVHRTGGQASADLLAGRIEVAVQWPQFLVPHVKSGDLRMLALLSSVPDPVFPDVKSAQAQGYNIDMPLWRGVLAPKGTPKALVARLQDAIKRSMESPEFKDASQKIGFIPAYLPSNAFTKMIADDDALIAATIRIIKESESK